MMTWNQNTTCTQCGATDQIYEAVLTCVMPFDRDALPKNKCTECGADLHEPEWVSKEDILKEGYSETEVNILNAIQGINFLDKEIHEQTQDGVKPEWLAKRIQIPVEDIKVAFSSLAQKGCLEVQNGLATDITRKERYVRLAYSTKE